MNRPQPALLVAAVLVGAATASITTLLLFDALEAPPTGSEPVALPGPGRLGSAELPTEATERIEALERQHRDFLMRLTDLESRNGDGGRRPAADLVTQADLDALRTELARPAGAKAAGVGDPATFQEQVAVALESIRHAEAVAAAEKKHEARRAKIDERVAGMAKWLELDGYQAEGVRSALVLQDERELDLLRRWEAGEDRALLGEQKLADHEAFVADVGQHLGPAQLETFLERFGGRGGK